MKVLVIKTIPGAGAVSDKYTAHFRQAIQKAEPTADIDVCEAVDGAAIPNVKQYDLVVFTGGTFDLLTKEPTEWVLRIMDVVREIHADEANNPKLLGICWGHQVIQKTLGGQLGALAEGPRVGVEQLSTTPTGQEFFGKDSLRLHKFHKRYVASTADGFTQLSPDNEIFLSNSGKMLSFQSHPEFSSEMTDVLLEDDVNGFYKEPSTPKPGVILKDKDSEHDGAYVWGKIMEWVRQ